MASAPEKLIFLLTAAVLLAGTSDIVTDLSHGSPLRHVIQEMFLMGLAAVLLLRMLWGMRQQKRLLDALKRELVESRSSAKAISPLVQSARERLSEAVDAQFRE